MPPSQTPATAEAGPLEPVSQAITLTPEQLAEIIGRALQSVTQQLATLSPSGTESMPAVSAASFPQFVPPPDAVAITGTSLLDQFPSVKQSVLLEIARHEFEPSDLYKLDSKFRDKAVIR
ncbi:hypothetical protein BC628DRAFT_1416803 [Trametes gibbosa]|nr:hypothetical protein BC628DRAFT_1416803 [Trametes gibbosa]